MPLFEPPGLHPAWSRAAGAPLASRSEKGANVWRILISSGCVTQIHTGRYGIYAESIRYLHDKRYILIHDSQVDLVQVQFQQHGLVLFRSLCQFASFTKNRSLLQALTATSTVSANFTVQSSELQRKWSAEWKWYGIARKAGQQGLNASKLCPCWLSTEYYAWKSEDSFSSRTSNMM